MKAVLKKIDEEFEKSVNLRNIDLTGLKKNVMK